MRAIFWLEEFRQAFPPPVMIEAFSLTGLSRATRFLSSSRGLFLSIRARVRPYSGSRSISGACSKRARAMSLFLALRRWRVCKSSDSILRRCGSFLLLCLVGFSAVVGNMVDVRFTLLASIFIQVAAHPKVIEWNKSLECLTR